MGHVPDGTIRRLVDEPLAVSDKYATHVAGCSRCGTHRAIVEKDADMATALLSRPQPVPDVGEAWQRLQAASLSLSTQAGDRLRAAVPARRRWQFGTLAVPQAAVVATAAVVVAAAGGAGLTLALLGPTRPAPAKTSTADFQALADLTGVDGTSGVLGGFGSPSGSLKLPFGVLQWSSSGRAHTVPSVAAARAATGLDVVSPAHMPAGVGEPAMILVQPAVEASISFGVAAGGQLAGTTLRVDAGPAVLIEYGGSLSGLHLPTLAIFVMHQPTVVPGGATTSQLEAFVLSHPGVPAGVSQELRLLEDPGAVLSLLTPAGAQLTQVDIDGSLGVLVTDSDIGASGVLWEDHAGLIHAAVGLLDQKDILSVADQLG